MIPRLGGLAAMLGGAMWVAKGGLIMLGFPDPNTLIAAELFLAFGLLGLHDRLGGRGALAGKIGGFLAYAAVALSLINAPHSLISDRMTLPFNATYFVATLAVFLGLMFLGIAVLRTEALPSGWRYMPLILGLSALLPVWVLAFVHLELPIVALGLAWMLLGYVLLSRKDEVVRRFASVES